MRCANRNAIHKFFYRNVKNKEGDTQRIQRHTVVIMMVNVRHKNSQMFVPWKRRRGNIAPQLRKCLRPNAQRTAQQHETDTERTKRFHFSGPQWVGCCRLGPCFAKAEQHEYVANSV